MKFYLLLDEYGCFNILMDFADNKRDVHCKPLPQIHNLHKITAAELDRACCESILKYYYYRTRILKNSQVLEIETDIPMEYHSPELLIIPDNISITKIRLIR